MRSVTIKLFARAAELAETSSAELSLPADATIDTVRASLLARFPRLASIGPSLLFAIGTEFAGNAVPVPVGAVVACFPPVSGG